VTRHVDARHGVRPVSDAAAVAIAKELSSIRSTCGVFAYPAVGRLEPLRGGSGGAKGERSLDFLKDPSRR
jgi:hypothetical protein